MILAVLLLPVLLTAVGFSYGILVCCFSFLYIIAVSGLDVDFGYCGQISMGHAAFFAIGAYGSVMLHTYCHLPVLLTMIIATLLATVIGAIIAYPASKLVFHFLSLATIAFGEIVYSLILNSPGGITNNAVGMFTDPINLFGFSLDTNTKFYYFGLVAVALFLVAKQLMIHSKVTCREAMPHLRQTKGCIANISSLVAIKGIAARAAYSASKGAVLALSRAMAADSLKDGVRVNCVSPGTVLSPSLQGRIDAEEDPAKAYERYVSRQPMGRLGTPEEIAAAVIYVCSAEAAFLDGVNLPVDGAGSL